MQDITKSKTDSELDFKETALQSRQSTDKLSRQESVSSWKSYTTEPSPGAYLILVVLCFVNLFANSAYSSIAPFYPAEAIRKGVPSGALGLVFSSYSISMVVFAPVFANMLFTKGSKHVLVLGCICEGISMVIFGLFYYLEGAWAYAICSFLCRVLEGFGNGCLNSSCKFNSIHLNLASF